MKEIPTFNETFDNYDLTAEGSREEVLWSEMDDFANQINGHAKTIWSIGDSLTKIKFGKPQLKKLKKDAEKFEVELQKALKQWELCKTLLSEL